MCGKGGDGGHIFPIQGRRSFRPIPLNSPLDPIVSAAAMGLKLHKILLRQLGAEITEEKSDYIES